MMDRIFSAVVALSLALLVWLYARSRDQEILDNVPVPVQVVQATAQADNYSLEVGGNGQVLVSFTGPPIRIRELRGILQRGELHIDLTYTVPEEHLNEGRVADTLRVESSDVHAPPGVSAMPVEGRNRVPVTLHRVVERRLPVRVDCGPYAPAMSVEVEPATVLVRGPQEVLDRARAIPTQPSILPSRPPGTAPEEPAIGQVTLVTELEGRPVRAQPPRVRVRVQPQVRKLYELTEVPIHFLCPANLQLRPRFIDERAGKLNVRVQGPIQDEPPRIYAFVDLTRGRLTAGLNHEPLQLQLPKDFSAAQEPQRVVAFELVPLDFAPKGLGGLMP
jgi:hypothetical protein